MDWNNNEFNFLINHVCFPIKLPDSSTEDEIKHESLFFKLLSKVIEASTTVDFIITKNISLYEIIRLFDQWSNVQQDIYLDGRQVAASINMLKENETAAFYLRCQNCTFLVSRKLNSYTASAFQASASNNQVMSSESDLIGIYPAFSVYVKHEDVLLSQSFGTQIAELANKEINYAISQKAGVGNIEIRDVTEPKIVFEWITAVLVDHHSSVCDENQIKIAKKIRDDVIHSYKLLPFRRSGLWMSIKVILQLRLTELFGETNGKIIYKIIMVLVINKLCEQSSHYELSSDMKLQMIKKLARRLYKLDLKCKYANNQHHLQSLFQTCSKTIENVKEIMNKKFKKFVENTRSDTAELDLNKIDLNDITHLHLNELINEINKLKSVSIAQYNKNVPMPSCSPRNMISSSFPDLKHLSSIICFTTILYDIEKWVKNIKFEKINKTNSINSKNLLNLLEKYLNKASDYYKEDPTGYSRMILTCMKIGCLLDLLATNEHLLLKDYKLGFDIKPLEVILAPNSSDLLYVKSIKDYIESRNKNSIYDSLVDSQNIKRYTFSVKFASSNIEMQTLKRKIIEDAEYKKRLKIEELERERKRYYDLLSRISQMTCTYSEKYPHYHVHSCHKCSLERQANRMSVDIYEWPLPANENLVNVVIFELLIPESICYLRDAFHLIRTKLFGFLNKDNRECYGTWIRYSELNKYSLKIQRYVTYGSFTKLFAQSHYKSAHPRNLDSHFLKPNGYSVSYCDMKGIFGYNYIPTYEKYCILKVSYPYDCLQWTVDGTSHTENQVLAAQSKCPHNLTINEFLKFGFLRAGHRLQLRNLMAAIEMRSLPFKHQSVYSLLAQTLWQVGPLNDCEELKSNLFYPSSHADLSNAQFLEKFHEILDKFLTIIAKSWSDSIIICNIIIIISRAIGLAPDKKTRELMVSLMFQCRSITHDWINSLQEVINNPKNVSKSSELQIKLFEICCYSILTYSVDIEHLELVLNNSEHVFQWFIAMVNIHDNKIVSNADYYKKNLYRMVLICMLNVQELMNKIIQKDTIVLTKFVDLHWPNAKEGEIQMWYNYNQPANQCYHAYFISKNNSLKLELQLGINGGFLVQGFPFNKLPEAIYNHHDFKDFFEITNFDVTLSSDGAGTYVTKQYSSLDSYYTFYSSNVGLIIKEKRSISSTENSENQQKEKMRNIEEFLFLKESFFQKILPTNLIKCYSHWFNISKNIIEFRVKSYSDYLSNKTVYFQMDLNTLLVYDVIMEQYLIDIKSNTFKEIYDKIMRRLELFEYIHVLNKNKQLNIDLPRMGLVFELNKENNFVMSRDYRGMMVSYSQQIETFLGLEKGLVLCEDVNVAKDYKEKSKRRIIIPNGKLNNKRIADESEHHCVDIEINSLCTPPFYIYDFDCYLKTLRAEESIDAWLYLAWLHAATSHVLPDPFLGITGTEMSIKLLQSGNCWSSKPLNERARSILYNISTLTPRRNFYPANKMSMQVINWPLLPSLAAQETFKWLSESITNDSLKFSFAYMSNNNGIKSESIISFLSQRAYHRHKTFDCNSEGVNTNFKTIMGEEKFPTLALDTKYEWCTPGITYTRIILTNVNSTSSSYNLESFLFQSQTLIGISDFYQFNSTTLVEWYQLINAFRDNWLNLYNYFRHQESDEINKKLMLAFFAYNEIPLDHLLFLQAVSNNSKLFKHIDPPSIREFNTGYGYKYDPCKIIGILNTNYIAFSDFKGTQSKWLFESDEMFIRRIENLYELTKSEEIRNLEIEISSCWNYSPSSKIQLQLINFINREMILKNINNLFRWWSENLELKKFIDRLQETHKYIPKFSQKSISNFETKSAFNKKSIYKKTIIDLFIEINEKEKLQKKFEEMKNCYDSEYHELEVLKNFDTSIGQNLPNFPIEPESDGCDIKNAHLISLEESWCSYFKNNKSKIKYNEETVYEFCKKKFNLYAQNSDSIWKTLIEKIDTTSSINKILQFADFWPRIVPVNILKWFINKKEERLLFETELLDAFREIAVLWSMEQRMLRCMIYTRQGDSMKIFLTRELFENRPYQNWSPIKYPEWLVIMLEQNFMVRNVQVDVAEKMMSPPENQNTTMQLNMGEGKTAVIIPLLVSALANDTNIVRVVVLKPLFNINYKSLVQKLGGIINRRVYIFPCQRDIGFTTKTVKLYGSIYRECQKLKGVILCLPEYINSFKLKGLEMCRSGDTEVARLLIETQAWLDKNARDILDESDELLSVKYQLVYPIGNITLVDGGNMRWLVGQAVLDLASHYFEELKNMFGDSSIEFHKNVQFPQAYPTFRFLNDESYHTLCEKICVDILKGKASDILKFPELRQFQIEHIKSYILDPIVDKKSFEITNKIFPFDSMNRKVVQILRGYFTYKVFYVIFCKRWRVEYGVNLKRKDLLQAVPYRAKDVPAERAQYAHPDIMILLTQLSYFYSGLTDQQLDNVFERLAKRSDASYEYKSWIETLPKKCNVDDSIKEYCGINLHDSNQKLNKLYPLLKFHYKVINYWLCEFVFPKEAKQFRDKFETSAWDLCQIKTHPISGFSGTNDSRLLLPLTTHYYEIPELKVTNGMLINYLLLPENNHYFNLPSGTNGRNIINTISQDSDSIRVLLDVGALMLELSNEDVIVEWLKLRKDVEAGIFFDSENNLVVIDRKSRKTMFEISSYRSQIDKCVVYLDESHTRGTDIKFPHGTIGAVTLGKGVTKDRLLQGCMRLRMLGHGHSVKFYASYEVNENIINMKNLLNKNQTNDIKTLDVLKWTLNNTCKQTADGFLYWALQGISLYRRESIYMDYLKHNEMSQYGKNTIEHDAIELSKIYEKDRFEDKFVHVISNKLNYVASYLSNISTHDELYKNKTEKIIERLTQYVCNKLTYSHLLEEEQELELEVEQEEEKEIEKPPSAKPKINYLDEDVKKLVMNGVFNEKSTSFLKLTHSLDKSSLNKIIQHGAWSDKLFVTRDFTDTVHPLDKMDEYIRPPRWFCVHKKGNTEIIVFLSDYETNQLFNYFKANTALLATFLPRSREDQERVLAFPIIDLAQDILEQMGVFTGSLYFNNEIEQNAFISFIGYCPSPRNKIQQNCFEDELINQNGFVCLENRLTVFSNQICKFKADPDELITKLIELRNYGIVPNSAHHLTIIRSGRKNVFSK